MVSGDGSETEAAGLRLVSAIIAETPRAVAVAVLRLISARSKALK